MTAQALTPTGIAVSVKAPPLRTDSTLAALPNRRTLLALDPGIRHAGVALFVDRRLVASEVVRNPLKVGNEVLACVSMAREIGHWLLSRELLIGDLLAIRPGDPRTTEELVDELIAEWPQVYAVGKGRGDPNDLPPLAGVGCALAALLPNATLNSTLPAAWKGQVPGDAFLSRILDRLDTTERACVDVSKSTAHNAIDAIGLGLFHLGRMDRRRVIPR
jgi:hypothetical protein